MMFLAGCLLFASGLLVGYALFSNRSGPQIFAFGSASKPGGSTKASASGISSATKTFSSITGKKPPPVIAALTSSAALLAKNARKSGVAASNAGAHQPQPAASAASGVTGASGAAGATGASGSVAAAPVPVDYCLQIGAFTNPKLAQQLQATLKEKGYTATIFEGLDVGYKKWHAVRISTYPDIDSATKAAAEFNSKEGLEAIVRPSGQL